jgi:hypothetical protein
MATAILAMLPPVLVVVGMQRLFVKGLGGKREIRIPMAELTLSNVGKTYPADRVATASISPSRRRVHRHRRPVGLRQVHAPAHGRGA